MDILIKGANEQSDHEMQLVEKNNGNKFIFIGWIG